jgi:hypothetical protein
MNYNIDLDIAAADELRDSWQKDPILYFRPNPGGQQRAWDCTRQNQIYLGGNRSGKTRVLYTKICAMGIPHPQDNNYSFWPDNLELRRKGFKIDLRHGVELWISKRSYTDHEDVTMKYLWEGFRGASYIPPLLKGRVRRAENCPNFPNVWRTVELNNGTLITLKSEQSGKRSYEGSSKTAVAFDEPADPDCYNEGKQRVIDTRGYTLYGMTGAMQVDSDPSVWKNIVYVRDKLLSLGDNGNTPFQEVIYLPTSENPYIDHAFQMGQVEGLSEEEKLVRLTGQIRVATGDCFFNLDDLSFLRRSVTPAQFIGTLEENFREEIIGTSADAIPTWSVYVVENEYSSFPLYVYHYPEPGKRYAIGVDVGGGGDYTAAVVMDEEYRICALQHGHIDEISLALELSKLGRYYCDAWIAPEVNKEGRVTASWLYQGNSDLGLKRYKKLFRRTKSVNERRGYVNIPGTDIGWLTTGGQSGTRSELLAGLRELIIRAKREAYEDYVLINCDKFLDECSTFCLHPDGKYEALSGSHDDIIIATGIAIQCLKTYVIRKRKPSQQQRPLQPAYSINPAGQLTIDFNSIIAMQQQINRGY